MLDVIPPEAALTLFIWGVSRIVPVRMESVKIVETMFDTRLNPTMATVSVSLKVLTYEDFDGGLLSVGGALFLSHQIVKEVLATIGGIGTVQGVAQGIVNNIRGI